MKKIEIELDDDEYDFIQKAKSIYKQDEGVLPFERFLIMVGIGAYIKYTLTGSILESEEMDFLWSEITRIILMGYSEWMEEIKSEMKSIEGQDKPKFMFM